MPYFGKRSLERLGTCHPSIKYVLQAAIHHYDFTIICGHRSKAEQDAAYYSNPQRSQVKWPNSRHNIFPSQAVDIAPWYPTEPHIRWDRKYEFIYLAGIIVGIADEKGVPLRWGGNWDLDMELITDQHLVDLPHIELIL